MPIAPLQFDNEEVLEVVADRAHVLRQKSRFFNNTYILENARGQKYVRPGMVLAVSDNKYVPYSVGASYGTGSNTAVAVLDEFMDLTLGDIGIDPIAHAKLIEAHCYAFGVALGTISAAIKTDLALVEWV